MQKKKKLYPFGYSLMLLKLSFFLGINETPNASSNDSKR